VNLRGVFLYALGDLWMDLSGTKNKITGKEWTSLL